MRPAKPQHPAGHEELSRNMWPAVVDLRCATTDALETVWQSALKAPR